MLLTDLLVEGTKSVDIVLSTNEVYELIQENIEEWNALDVQNKKVDFDF